MKKRNHLKPIGRQPKSANAVARPEHFLAAGLTLDMLPPLPLAQRAPRRIVTRSGARVRGINLATPNSRRVEWESPYEANAIVVLSLCKTVVRVFSQPLVLEIGGMQYTPDLLVFLTDGRRVWIECKPDADNLDPETDQKLSLVHGLLRGVGDRFVILDAKDLADDSPIVDNCRYLLRWLDLASSELALPSHEVAKYGELLGKYGVNRVNATLAAGSCRFDLTKPLTSQTLVVAGSKGGAYEHAFLHS